MLRTQPPHTDHIKQRMQSLDISKKQLGRPDNNCCKVMLQTHTTTQLLQFEWLLFQCFCFLFLLLSTSTVSTRFMRPQTALRWRQRFATFSSSSPILSTATFTLLNLHLQFHHCHLHASAGRTKSGLGLEHGSEVPMLGKDFWRFCTIADDSARLRKVLEKVPCEDCWRICRSYFLRRKIIASVSEGSSG